MNSRLLPAGIRRSLIFLAIFGLTCYGSATLYAHDPGLSTLEITLAAESAKARLALAISDAKLIYPMGSGSSLQLSQDDFERAQLGLEEVALGLVTLTCDGHPSPSFLASASFVPIENDIVLEIFFERPPAEHVVIDSKVLEKLPSGHRQYLKLVDAEGQSLGEHMLEASQSAHEFSLTQKGTPTEHVGIFEFIKLGVEHIVTGYDHLVFLFGLLIIGGRFKSILTTVTAFTIAHSLTLSAATLEWVRLPAFIVEPLIALSIVYVGVENLVRKNPKQRWMPAFGFGLIHGLGFASLLSDLGVGAPGTSILQPLLAFNLGVELGQITLAAIAMPIIWKLNRAPVFQSRWLPVCSILICLAGTFWLVERTWGL